MRGTQPSRAWDNKVSVVGQTLALDDGTLFSSWIEGAVPTGKVAHGSCEEGTNIDLSFIGHLAQAKLFL